MSAEGKEEQATNSLYDEEFCRQNSKYPNSVYPQALLYFMVGNYFCYKRVFRFNNSRLLFGAFLLINLPVSQILAEYTNPSFHRYV